MHAHHRSAAAIIGTTIEFYDFSICATVAARGLGRLFFPSNDPVTSMLAAFGSFCRRPHRTALSLIGVCGLACPRAKPVVLHTSKEVYS